MTEFGDNFLDTDPPDTQIQMSDYESQQCQSAPCLAHPAVSKLMQAALPCSCGTRQLLLVSDLHHENPTYAVACDDCGEIEGDAPTLKQAIINWNAFQTRGSLHH